MIFDHLKNRLLYESVHTSFTSAFDFIERAVRESLPVGRYEIDGDALYAIVQEYETKSHEDCTFEGHRKYIDIQYMVSGSECMGVAALANVEPKTEYNEERDFLLFENSDLASTLTVNEGEFAVFYPHDAHRPGMAFGAPATIRKIVVKIKV